MARLAAVDRCRTGGARGGAIGLMQTAIGRSRCRLVYGRAAMTMSFTILAVVVTPGGCDTAGERIDLGRRGKRCDGSKQPEHPQKSKHNGFNLQRERRALVISTRLFHVQTCPFQYRSHRAAMPDATIAHDTSPPLGDVHHAAVLLPPPEPADTHRIVRPCTVTCPYGPVPMDWPKSRTSASRASNAPAAGQGCRGMQEPSISRAAIPASRILGPSSHQIGPPPSHTATGVQAKASPAGIEARRKSENIYCRS